jgi:hypothetical protein
MTSISANETMNTTNMTSTNASYNLTTGNVSSVMPDTASGQQQGDPSRNWLALTIIAIPAILAALVVVIQFVRKTE